MISVRNLGVSIGSFALDAVNLELRAGGCLAILGPSGAGKTLLLETVMGAHRPDRGTVMLDGRDITRLPAEMRQIAYIPQDLALFPHLDVQSNITFGLPTRAARRNPGEDFHRLIAMLGIQHLVGRRDVMTLSGGEKQRVALARALIVQPRVLFLDEPFAALDAATRTDLLHALRRLRLALGTTVFLVTHELDEACFLADDLAIMMAGRIVASGPANEIIRQPRTTSVARFLNLRNIVPIGVLEAAGLVCAKNQPGGATHMALRPEDIAVLRPGEGPQNAPRARLESLIPMGSRIIAELTLGEAVRLEASLTPAHADMLNACLNQMVTVIVRPEDLIELTDDGNSGDAGSGANSHRSRR